MNNLLRLSYYISIIAIVVWFFRPLVFWIIGIEFADSDMEMNYSYGWRFVLPIAIFLTITKEYMNGRKPNSLVKSILFRVGLSALSVLVVFMSLFLNMCGWYEKDVYYESKNDSSRVALMEYGCGAYDSDSNPRQEVKLIKPLNRLLYWSHDCDTTTLDQNEWVKIK